MNVHPIRTYRFFVAIGLDPIEGQLAKLECVIDTKGVRCEWEPIL